MFDLHVRSKFNLKTCHNIESSIHFDRYKQEFFLILDCHEKDFPLLIETIKDEETISPLVNLRKKETIKK